MVKLIDEYILKCKDNIKLFDEYRSKNQSYFLLEKNSGDLIETILNTFVKDIDQSRLEYFYDKSPDYVKDLTNLKCQLEGLKARKLDEEKTSKESLISIIQNQTNTQVVNISFEQTVNAVKSIPENELSADEKKELLEKLKKLESDKDKSEIWKTAQSVLKWIADKGVDVAIAVLPYIVEVLKNPK